MKVLGIDPAFAKSSWACSIDDELNITLHEIEKTEDLEKILEEEKPDIVYVEDQYLGRNPSTMAKLIKVRSELILYCQLAGVPNKLVKPSQWQSTLPLKTRKRGEIKKWSKIVAKSIFNGQIDPFKINLTDDQADAINIAWYALRQEQSKKIYEQNRSQTHAKNKVENQSQS